MACHFPSGSTEESECYTSLRNLHDELNKLTRMLCECCKRLENKQCDYPNKEIKEWWENHKIQDLRDKAWEEQRRLYAEQEKQIAQKRKIEQYNKLKQELGY